MLTYLLAVLAACANATSSVLQRKANRQVRAASLSWQLIRSLLHQPTWFGGVLAVTAGFLLQASALGTGDLAVVEPILVLELPLTLILAAQVFRAPMRGREWASAIVMSAGLAGLLYFLAPSGGTPRQVPAMVWLAGTAVNLAVVAGLVAWGRRGSSAHQAAVLGTAGGSAFGLTAALMKGMTFAFSAGLAAVLLSWQLYAMIAAGALGLFLVQSAMNAGRLLAAQPGLTLSDPLVSILWGVLAFHEQVRGGIYLLLAALSGLTMAGAVVALARSPLLSRESQPGGDGAAGEQGAGDRRPPAGLPGPGRQ